MKMMKTVIGTLLSALVTSLPASAMDLVQIDPNGPNEMQIRFSVEKPAGIDYRLNIAYGENTRQAVNLSKATNYSAVIPAQLNELMKENEDGIVSWDLKTSAPRNSSVDVDAAIVVEVLQGENVVFTRTITPQSGWMETRRGNLSEKDPAQFLYSDDLFVSGR